MCKNNLYRYNIQLYHISNGVNIADLRRIANFELRGGIMYKVEITNKSNYLFNVKSKDYEFAIDVKGKGITPPDTLLASIGSCLGVYLRKYAEGTKLALKDFNITVQADFCEEKPMRFKDISVTIDLNNLKLDETKMNALLHFIKNCPVHNTLEIKPNVEVKII